MTLLATVAALAACALWIAAVTSVQAVGDRARAKASDWEDAVSAGQPVRLSGETSGPATRSTGTFGDSWHLSVTVEAFGHPVRPAPVRTEVVVSGGEDWQDVDPGTRVCFTWWRPCRSSRSIPGSACSTECCVLASHTPDASSALP